MKGELNFKQALQFSNLPPFDYISSMELFDLEPPSSETIENKSFDLALVYQKNKFFPVLILNGKQR
jgi:hypothetical protein